MGLFKNKKHLIMAPTSGYIKALKHVNDPMFSQALMGPGIAIKSIDGNIYSPVDGVVKVLFPTYHAIGIKSQDGEDILIHIGIDTVQLNGEGFLSYVEQGEMVHKGDLLLKVDLQLIQEKGYSDEVIICITEPQGIQVSITEQSNVKAIEDVLMSIKK